MLMATLTKKFAAVAMVQPRPLLSKLFYTLVRTLRNGGSKFPTVPVSYGFSSFSHDELVTTSLTVYI
jgi:hypothetical protein